MSVNPLGRGEQDRPNHAEEARSRVQSKPSVPIIHNQKIIDLLIRGIFGGQRRIEDGRGVVWVINLLHREQRNVPVCRLGTVRTSRKGLSSRAYLRDDKSMFDVHESPFLCYPPQPKPREPVSKQG